MKLDKKLLAILLFAFILWVWNISAVDLVSDDALYSFRALGWHDYLATDGQTTPFQWFGHIPWWANLSFHDAPPLVFGVQKVFFSIFGDNPVGARLPFVFSFLSSLYFVFLIGKELHSKKAGYLACFLMAIMSLAAYGAGSGLLEGVEVLFIALAVYSWVKFIKTDNNKYLYLLFIFFSLALMSKYTAVFLPVAFLAHLLFFRREVFKRKELYLACLIFILILSPVIIYNIGLYQTRGHFDAALASFLGQETDDFFSLRNREISPNFFHGLKSIFNNLLQVMSLPAWLLFLTAIIYNIYKIIRGEREKYFVFLAGLASAFILLALAGAGSRFLIILMPFIVLLIGVLLAEASFKINQKILFIPTPSRTPCGLAAGMNGGFKSFLRGLIPSRKVWGFILMAIIFSWELAYNINSNFLTRPLTRNFLLYSQENLGAKKFGFNKLDKYLRDEVFINDLDLQRPKRLKDIDIRAIDYADHYGLIYFFDDSLNWFAHNWYFRKYINYYGLPLAPLSEQAKTLGVADPIKYFSELGIKNYYFIYGVDESLVDPKKLNSEHRQTSTKLAQMLDGQGVKYQEIKNHLGQAAFRVYQFSLK
ncbi:hypothetical protein A3B87_03090 [Candidatus Kuenenbacteria bacterium RIFCSPHIGHO2_02_FULL_39_13]|uniref:Glycosyltransferase RgtA/B/C/D-like domain-containing protein n=1 Tax=Candidatus Kuenenbacteria bacterium RIFCSPHIGHO2_02_FULL_39_13 TaxID=1798561 RepID=A0A1F6FMV6_9BACT|nr:MAG: hypothetical protein A3B87_03090 [Candidatus Kuenenbacteria bacterium RIFCSPHIGHO2_02_FULL_39_13]